MFEGQNEGTEQIFWQVALSQFGRGSVRPTRSCHVAKVRACYCPVMVELVIPPDKAEGVQSEACADWLLANTTGSVIGHVEGGQFLLRFSDPAEAEAFSRQWL